jgi:hypothetical protein
LLKIDKPSCGGPEMNRSGNPLRLIGMLALLAALVWLLAGVFGEMSRGGAMPGEGLPDASATADDRPPSPLPPTDDGVRVPPCCTPFPVDVNSLPPEQATAFAQLPPPQQITPQPTWDGIIPSSELVPFGVFLTPSAEWATYKDPDLGFSFEYPANLTVDVHNNGLNPKVPMVRMLQVNIFNHPLNDGYYYPPGSKESFSVTFFITDSKASTESLKSYAGRKYGDPSIWTVLSLTEEELPNGYPALRLVEQSSARKNTLIFIEHGEWVYTLIAHDSPYNAIFERTLASLVLP